MKMKTKDLLIVWGAATLYSSIIGFFVWLPIKLIGGIYWPALKKVDIYVVLFLIVLYSGLGAYSVYYATKDNDAEDDRSLSTPND